MTITNTLAVVGADPTLHLNRGTLAPAVRPSRLASSMTSVAAVFFAAFAVLYPLQLAGVLGS